MCKGICGHVTSLHGGLTEAETQLETAVDTHSQVETEVDTHSQVETEVDTHS